MSSVFDLTGTAVDSAIRSLAHQIVREEKRNGFVADVPATVAKYNERSQIVAPESLADLQFDVGMQVDYLHNRKTRKVSALGMAKHKALTLADRLSEEIDGVSGQAPIQE